MPECDLKLFARHWQTGTTFLPTKSTANLRASVQTLHMGGALKSKDSSGDKELGGFQTDFGGVPIPGICKGCWRHPYAATAYGNADEHEKDPPSDVQMETCLSDP